MYDGE
jgi:hypothetical protein